MKTNPFLKIESNLRTIYYKIRSPFECENHKLKVLLNEFTFIIQGFRKYRNINLLNRGKIVLNTKLGKYEVRNSAFDLITASPAFERKDLEVFISLMDDSLKSGRPAVLIDIGADFGKYTIASSLKLQKYANKLRVFAFEPDKVTFSLLKKNVQLNGLKNVKLFNAALSDREGKKDFYFYKPAEMIVSFITENKIRVNVHKLDKFKKIFGINQQTDLFVKIDVEGHEIPVLRGGNSLLGQARTTTLLVEDVFNENNLRHYLNKKAVFLNKTSVQNSFWRWK